jgi:hypothetical protein
MKLEQINFHNLRRFHYSFWGSGNKLRYHYYNEERYYKIWSRQFGVHKLINVGDRYVLFNSLHSSALASFSCGLLDASVAPAFIEYVVDHTNYCRGYITRRGQPLKQDSEIPALLVDKLIANSLTSGFAFPDLKPGNVVKIGEAYSLIDFDSPPVCLESLDLEFQRKAGFLREGQCKRYAEAILEHLAAKR